MSSDGGGVECNVEPNCTPVAENIAIPVFTCNFFIQHTLLQTYGCFGGFHVIVVGFGATASSQVNVQGFIGHDKGVFY